jgi:hypothetical protein
MDLQALERRYAITWLTLSVLLIGLPVFARAAEAPGGMTILVKDEITDRPLGTVQITITERQTNSTRSVETDAQAASSLSSSTPASTR